jgi:hypothetical protein
VRQSKTCRPAHARPALGSQVGVTRCTNEVKSRGAHWEATSCKLSVGRWSRPRARWPRRGRCVAHHRGAHVQEGLRKSIHVKITGHVGQTRRERCVSVTVAVVVGDVSTHHGGHTGRRTARIQRGRGGRRVCPHVWVVCVASARPVRREKSVRVSKGEHVV